MDYNCEIDVWLRQVITRFCHSINLGISNDSYYYQEMELLINATLKRMLKYNMAYKANELHLFFNFRSSVKMQLVIRQKVMSMKWSFALDY